MQELPAEAIAALLAHAGPGSGSPLACVELRQVGGALRRAAPGHGAVAGMDAQFVLFVGALALDADMAALMLGHADRITAALAPWLGAGQYLNFAEERRRHRADLRRRHPRPPARGQGPRRPRRT